ncbi:hypothetical protein ACTVZO_38410 [Streptomyces sp. IBSNAI002]|uniref:hypothetical protein n=1 Tax=Streptomyces sp. IBSNAI002 TaxID=3457500 RepID=UPI003FD1637D
METNHKKGRAVPAGLTAEDAAYLKKRGPLPVYRYRRKDALRQARLVGKHLDAVGGFVAADLLTRVMAGKELERAQALLLRNAIAQLHAELEGGTRTGGAAGPGGSAPDPVPTQKDARAALVRAVAMLKDLAAGKEDMAQCMLSVLRLEDSLSWRAPGDTRPAKAGAHTAERDLSRLLSGLLEAERALRDSADALGRTLGSDAGEQGYDAVLKASLTRARGDLAGLRTAVEAYHDTIARLCGDVWERAVDTARAEFTGAVDHYDPVFALKVMTFKAGVTVLSAACTAASAVCPPLAAVTVGIAVGGVVGPAAAMKARAARETTDPNRVAELLSTKAVPTRDLKKAAQDKKAPVGSARAGKHGLRTAGGRAADALDTTNEGFGVVSNVLSAGTPFEQGMATAAAALAESTLVMATTPAGAAVGLVSVVREAVGSELRTPVPVGDEKGRRKLPGDARAVAKGATRPPVRPAGAKAPEGRPQGVPLPDRCTAGHAFKLWNQVTQTWFSATAVFTLHRADAATLREHGPCMVVDGLTVHFEDACGVVRPLDLSRTAVVGGVVVSDLASAVIGTVCAARADATGAELLHPERYLPDQIDVVQAHWLLDPQQPGRLLDATTPYYALAYAALHVSYARPNEQEPYAWQVENLYEVLPEVEAEPFARWLEQAQGMARTLTGAAGPEYEDARF